MLGLRAGEIVARQDMIIAGHNVIDADGKGDNRNDDSSIEKGRILRTIHEFTTFFPFIVTSVDHII